MLGAKESPEVNRLQMGTRIIVLVYLTIYFVQNSLFQASELSPTLLLSFREALRVMSTLLHAAGHLLISSASVIRRIIQGADLLQAQHGKPIEYWE